MFYIKSRGRKINLRNDNVFTRGPVCGREHAVDIVETFRGRGIDPMAVPAVLVCKHGPFTWGKTCAKAVENALVLEECAHMARLTEQFAPGVAPAPSYLQDKHYFRKHGPNAYYGQK